MRSPERVVSALRARRQLWEPAPGLVGLRGDAAVLRDRVAREIATVTAGLAEEEWRMPAGLPLATLARADYFLSFPQWLTAASHLGNGNGSAESVAQAAEPAVRARGALVASEVALPPAVCYHVYAELAGQTVSHAARISGECICWRHEAAGFSPLVRDWSFTMREAVCVGLPQETEEFRRTGIAVASALADRLGLETAVVQAEDPFFLPTGRGRALLQRVKALKHELVIEPPGGSPIAIASFNHHQRFFGDAFRIRDADADSASSACVAFGVERWLLAFLVTHGPSARDWPEVGGAGDVASAAGGGDALSAVPEIAGLETDR